MIQNILSFLEQRSKVALTLVAAFLVICVGVGDIVTGVEIQLHFFYVLPIALVSWFVKGDVGTYLALLCNLVILVADNFGGRTYSAAWIPYWNFLMRGGVFIVIALTLSQLRSKFDILSELAARDFLTGLPNGRAFYELAASEMQRAFGVEPLTLACIDIQGFNWINHRFGYATGDQVLCTIAQTIKQSVPRGDLVGRIGGTSFALLLPNTTSDGANIVLENIQNALKEERRRYAQPVTFFISAIACSKAPRSVAELMHEAELRMSRMKSNSRDAIEIAHVDAAPALN